MRKWFIVLAAIFLFTVVCCRHEERQHVFHSYYGDVDTDTMVGLEEADGSFFYIIHTQLIPGVTSFGNADSLIATTFYNPTHNTYFMQLFGNDGGYSGRAYINPDSVYGKK